MVAIFITLGFVPPTGVIHTLGIQALCIPIARSCTCTAELSRDMSYRFGASDFDEAKFDFLKIIPSVHIEKRNVLWGNLKLC